MFTNKLYSHKYDIDDIINAMCEGNSACMRTSDGIISTNIPLKNDGYHYIIPPLDEGFIRSLHNNPSLNTLDLTYKDEIIKLVNSISSPNELTSLFTKTIVGGWIKDQVKTHAVNWLNEKKLIPPSMNHVISCK